MIQVQHHWILTGYLKSNRNFVEDIYQSLILQLNKQSGTQNKSKHHKSPSSSSKTSTDQPTQTSSSTQKTSKSSKSHSRFSFMENFQIQE
ncbi:hypothetical protein QVD99_007886 [Batrachochytrium dendrobatidis]|nr:hypothetical protein QVD99_007886 [Batrachochytrium dendrobatidis]